MPRTIDSPMGWPAAMLLAAAALCGCKPAATPAPPPPAVTVSRPAHQQLADWDEYPGRLSSPEMVELRARVTGFVESAPFQEGAIVNKGDVLFTIDVRPFQADLDRAQATLAQAQAQQRFQTGEYERMAPLAKMGAIAESQFLSTRQAMESANAAVQAAQAAVEAAQLNVEWCRVTAPTTGRASRKYVTPGNLITGGAAQGSLLTTITTLDPMYCYADVDERSVRRYQELVRQGVRPSGRSGGLPAEIELAGEQGFPHRGFVDFVDNQINATTGTITIRAAFANPDHRLLPGFYARMRILARSPHDTLLVPQVAISNTLAQYYVLTVGPDDIVQYRPVELGVAVDGLQAVHGIGAEDRVVVNGLVNARPGTKVTPKEAPIQTVLAHQAGTANQATSQPTGTQRSGGAASQSAPTTQPGSLTAQGQGPSRSSNGPAGDTNATGAGMPNSMGGGQGDGGVGGSGGGRQ